MLLAKNRAAFWALAAGSALFAAYAFGCGGEACHEGDCVGPSSGGAGGGTSSASATGTGGSGPQTTFPCKGEMCVHGEEQCEVQMDAVGADVGTCLPLPDECTEAGTIDPDCTCFTDLPDNCECTQTPDGDFAVFCQPV